MFMKNTFKFLTLSLALGMFSCAQQEEDDLSSKKANWKNSNLNQQP